MALREWNRSKWDVLWENQFQKFTSHQSWLIIKDRHLRTHQYPQVMRVSYEKKQENRELIRSKTCIMLLSLYPLVFIFPVGTFGFFFTVLENKSKFVRIKCDGHSETAPFTPNQKQHLSHPIRNSTGSYFQTSPNTFRTLTCTN